MIDDFDFDFEEENFEDHEVEIPYSMISNQNNKLFSITDYLEGFTTDYLTFKNVKTSNILDRKYPNKTPYFSINNPEDLYYELKSNSICILQKDDQNNFKKIVILKNCVILKEEEKLLSINFKNLEYINFSEDKDEYYFYNFSITFKYIEQLEQNFTFLLPKIFIINNQSFSLEYEGINNLKKEILNKITTKYIEFKLNEEMMDKI